MSKTNVIYKDVAPGADKDAVMSAVGADSRSDIGLLSTGVAPQPTISLEWNYWVLNGTRRPQETQPRAFWSVSKSDKNGRFSVYPVITVDFGKQYSSTGISFAFDRAAGEWCSRINVSWYQGEEQKASKEFYPDAVDYFCEQTVTSYDRIVITVKETSVPLRYAKIEHIIFGVYRRFGMAELRKASVVNEMDGISETLPISTFKWTLDSKKNTDFLFQLKQPVEIRNDDNLLGVYYIDKHDRKTARIYDIECYDAIGVLDESVFPGGVYTNKSAKELLLEIVGTDFDVEFAADVVDADLTGVLLEGTKRSAAQQVLFAWGVCAATDGGAVLRVFNLDDTLTEIGKDRTFVGVSVATDSIVTEVQLTAHTYTETDNGGIEINGKKYSDTKTIYTVKNPDVTANDKQNVKSFRDATLVSPSNAQALAQHIYSWYQRRNTAKASVVWEGERLGEFVGLPNTWGSASTGNVTKMEIKLSNTVVAKCEAQG